MSVTGAVLLLLLLAFPFGPALQNLAMALAVIAMLTSLIRRRVRPSWPGGRSPALRWAWFSMLGFLVWNVISTALNPANIWAEKTAYFVGYSPILILPWLAVGLPALPEKFLKRLESITAVVVLIWGLVSLSQVLWPWRWVGAGPMMGGIPRAQGFYSHPLTLAYAGLLIWPFAILRVFQKPKAWQSWGYALGTALILIYSMSRTVQALAALFVLFNIFRLFSGRRRWQILAVAALLGLGLAVTKNPVSTRFHNLIAGTGENDRFSNYPDDRLAFWDAHLLMIEDRPLLGHGVHLGLEFRHPYYVRLGLGDFKKQYQAHNQYLQIATEGGLIALAFFVAWLAFNIRAMQDSAFPRLLRTVTTQTFWIFILGGLTQNAFYDSDVRMGLVTLSLILALYSSQVGSFRSSTSTVMSSPE